LTAARVLVVGARGAIGTAIVDTFERRGWTVLPGTHALRAGDTDRPWVDVSDPAWASRVAAGGPLDAVVFAQGANTSGGIQDTSAADLDEMWQANVVVVAEATRSLLDAGALADPSRIVVISSVWQDLARAGKVAYTTSKAAVGGLVRALAVELAPQGVLVNAVLPGVLDTPMTRAHLSPESIARVTDDTPAGRLATVDDVARATYWLASDDNTGVTGESITVDLGWTVARRV
jgi:3-oxoacyl-[acyl-carrier protein] reductase